MLSFPRIFTSFEKPKGLNGAWLNMEKMNTQVQNVLKTPRKLHCLKERKWGVVRMGGGGSVSQYQDLVPNDHLTVTSS